jgi:hypothetical protein
MTSRFWRMALLLVAVLAALTLSTAGHTASDYRSSGHDVGGQAVATQAQQPVDELAVLLNGFDGRQPGSERSSKSRLTLFAVAAALLMLLVLRRRRMVAFARPVRLSLSPSLLPGARAPPPRRF